MIGKHKSTLLDARTIEVAGEGYKFTNTNVISFPYLSLFSVNMIRLKKKSTKKVFPNLWWIQQNLLLATSPI